MTTPLASRAVGAAPSRPSPPSGFRPDIQALRAIAISAVVLNHLWQTRFPGGYIGVDVFFVISGFLITGHLLRDAITHGRISLSSFYARRVRRLLPAALLVLVVSAIGVAVFLPYPQWQRNGAEILASATYVENWLLAVLSVDYSALNDSATVAQHYWSLSVEEQFYLVWPLVIVAAIWWAARRGLGRRVPLTVALAFLGVVSLGASAYFTVVTPTQAYFVTYARVWEFAAGGLIALGAHRIHLSGLWRNVLSVVGFLAIGASIFLLGPESPFPGVVAAIPVLGTVAVIVAGTGSLRQWHAVVTSSRPVQWVGDVSYSLYLWHWPLIVLAPFVLRAELSTTLKCAVLLIALVAAWATRKWVERPGQQWRVLRDSTKGTFLAMVAGMAIAAVAAAMLMVGFALKTAADQPPIQAATGTCLGPAALESAGCEDPFGPAVEPVMGPRNEYFWVPEECGEPSERRRGDVELTTVTCDFSSGETGSRDVWLVGDSHAQQWQNAVFDLAREHGWRVTTIYRGGCPVADVAFVGFRVPWAASDASGCRDWAREVTDEVAEQAPDIVFTSMAARHHLVDDGSDRSAADQWALGLQATWQRWTTAGSRVVVLADPPLNGEVRSTDCLVLNADHPLECAVNRDIAAPPDPLVDAAQSGAGEDAVLIDLTESFCDEAKCPAVIGGIAVYYDAEHLNLEYVRLLAPAIASQLSEQGLL